MYSILKEELANCDGEVYTSYGVKCIDNSFAVSDISQNKRKIDEFVSLINSNDLHIVHLMDVIEDFLDDLQ